MRLRTSSRRSQSWANVTAPLSPNTMALTWRSVSTCWRLKAEDQWCLKGELRGHSTYSFVDRSLVLYISTRVWPRTKDRSWDHCLLSRIRLGLERKNTWSSWFMSLPSMGTDMETGLSLNSILLFQRLNLYLVLATFKKTLGLGLDPSKNQSWLCLVLVTSFM